MINLSNNLLLHSPFHLQEAMKQVFSLEGNSFRTKGSKDKKEKEMIV